MIHCLRLFGKPRSVEENHTVGRARLDAERFYPRIIPPIVGDDESILRTNVQRISDPSGDASNHVFSPDDTLIAYQSNLDGDDDVYVYEVASGLTRLVTDNTIRDYAPTWW